MLKGYKADIINMLLKLKIQWKLIEEIADSDVLKSFYNEKEKVNTTSLGGAKQQRRTEELQAPPELQGNRRRESNRGMYERIVFQLLFDALDARRRK